MIRFINILIFLFLFVCKQKEEKSASINESLKEIKKDRTIINKNVTITISTDIEKLSTLLNFEKYRPIEVKYKYIFIDNESKKERLTIPVPSNNFLQAILHFDSTTLVFEK
jgi:hypothetical protein